MTRLRAIAKIDYQTTLSAWFSAAGQTARWLEKRRNRMLWGPPSAANNACSPANNACHFMRAAEACVLGNKRLLVGMSCYQGLPVFGGLSLGCLQGNAFMSTPVHANDSVAAALGLFEARCIAIPLRKGSPVKGCS
jgi:hypothetical protein